MLIFLFIKKKNKEMPVNINNVMPSMLSTAAFIPSIIGPDDAP
jgi:hypothetical protein